ncbi:hypothetical protein I4U23_021637 [Adineta vaga]|nr:hypothetical protein I4U23_021637 [Adineta vaga]
MYSMTNQYNRQLSNSSIDSIGKEFESLKCIPIQQESLFNGTFIQYYQCSNNNNRVNLNVKVEITQDSSPIRQFK